MSTTVRITETYDLKTTINKLGLIGIHTPGMTLIKKLYPGLLKNHKYIRVLSCDVVGACASVLPADPLQVGVESGDISPEDMFNPILYKAVSNESFDTLVNRIYVQNNIGVDSINFGEIGVAANVTDPFSIYYSQLADSKRWKKALPQRGFSMRGLYPICYTVINTYGNQAPLRMGDGVSDSGESLEIDSVNGYDIATTFKGKSVRMPRIPIHFGTENVNDVPNNTYIPRTFVMAILVPPARLNEFYYRMRVTWTIRFEEVCSALQTLGITPAQTAQISDYSYYKGYGNSKLAGAESKLSTEQDLVDTNDVSIKKIMES